ncbi:MAG: metallophosphoesterase [Phycisphaerae bacterium]|nr:metallophosphoesterase [Phycisphaerae bacterium]
MAVCFFVSDLHGQMDRYLTLFSLIAGEKPAAVFLGGDLFPGGLSAIRTLDVAHRDFVNDFLVMHLDKLRQSLGQAYPRVFVILGNDDSRSEEAAILEAAARGVWEYMHNRRASFGQYDVYGYAYVPPTPFLLKDWERYDVSRYVDLGCVSPEDGRRSIPVAENEVRHATIQKDLERLVGDSDLSRAVLLFHSPPYKTSLDRAALDGKIVDHAPLDVHVGSIAIQRLIEQRQPLITLHGHVHESARLTGAWSERIGRTHCFSAAHDGPELALVRFDPDDPTNATRMLM